MQVGSVGSICWSVLMFLGMGVLVGCSPSSSGPEQRLAAYFAAVNAADKTTALTFFREDEKGAEGFVEAQIAGRPYANLSYQTSHPFGDEIALVIVAGTSDGKPTTARYDLSRQDGKWMIFLGTQDEPTDSPKRPASTDR